MEDWRANSPPPFCIFNFAFLISLYASGFFAREALLVVVLRVAVAPPSFLVLRVVLVGGVTTDSAISETAEAASLIMSPTPETISEPISRMGAGMMLSGVPAAAAA